MTIRESVFVGNLGNNQGGVIRKQTPGPVLITRSSFLGNRVGGLGSVIAFTAGARMAIDNSLFVGNETTRATNGGVISIAGSSPGEIILTNVTMVGNESGAAVLIDGVADVTVQNSILVDNRERGAMSEQIIQQASASGLLTVRYSLVQGGFQGEGNLSGDPVFVRQPAPEEVDAGDFGDLRLDVASPAIDAGDNLADLDGAGDGVTTAGDLTLDLAGNVRRADMPDVPDSGLGDAPIIDLGAFEQRNLLFSDGFEEGQPGL